MKPLNCLLCVLEAGRFIKTDDSLTARSPVTYAEEGSYIVAAGKPGDSF